MANYVAWHGKKRKRLAEQVREFTAILSGGSDAAALVAGAERVRMAQIRALKAKRAIFPASEKNADAIATIDHEIEHWMALPVDGIVRYYREDLRGAAGQRVTQGYRIPSKALNNNPVK